MKSVRSSLAIAGDSPSHIRVVTASSLFDGHDAAINIMRRLLQSQGAEVIHLGHDRSVEEIVEAAVQEDASAVAVSSYQGGHMEFFRYLSARLKEQGAGHIRVYGGGGGTITQEEMDTLRNEGTARIFGPALSRGGGCWLRGRHPLCWCGRRQDRGGRRAGREACERVGRVSGARRWCMNHPAVWAQHL